MPMSATSASVTRHDWTLAEVKALFEQPFNDLLFQAQTVHRQHFDANRVQVPRCCRSRPAPARKTASTARNPATTTPASIKRS